MVSFRSVPVDGPDARALLTDYFDMRTVDFPPISSYLTVWPDPVQFTPPAGVFIVADDPGPIGCGGIRMLSPERAELKHVWMDPAGRRHGTGRALIEELIRRAREFGAAELVLDTHHSLESAARIYRDLGFAEIPAYNDNPNATHHFAKPLR